MLMVGVACNKTTAAPLSFVDVVDMTKILEPMGCCDLSHLPATSGVTTGETG